MGVHDHTIGSLHGEFALFFLHTWLMIGASQNDSVRILTYFRYMTGPNKSVKKSRDRIAVLIAWREFSTIPLLLYTDQYFYTYFCHLFFLPSTKD